jgi:alkylation response protein AidB-like acyl-CoA dehydrogenase
LPKVEDKAMPWSQLPAEHFLQAIDRLAPIILAERDAIEQTRGLSPHLFQVMRDEGFFSLWLPKQLGGPELSPADLVRTIEAIARADGSVGWCAGIASSNSRLAGYLAEPAARDILSNGRSVLAGTLAPVGRALVVPGGYRVSGQWSYGSGISHSNWVLGVCRVFEGNAQRTTVEGQPETLLAIFPKEECEVLDTWYVSGLRGTGSHDFRVTNLFVPEDRTLDAIAPPPTQPGLLYALPLITVFQTSIAGVPLGVARAAIDALMDLAEVKTPMGATQRLKDKPAVQAEFGRAEAILRSARAFLFEAIEALCHAGEQGTPSLKDRALVRMAAAHATASSAQVVDMMFNAGGGSSLYESCRLARCWRDAHAMTQHLGLSAANFETGGRVMLGMNPGTPRF